jgi:predicted negative regulator of RcsB-dependent stress response
MDEIESALTEARNLRALGKLKQAATRLESVSATLRDPQLLSERADILTSQGYWTKALSVLEGVKIEGHRASSGHVRGRIQMQLCFVRPVVEASFGQSVQTAKGLYQKYLLGIDWRHADRNLVSLNTKTSAVSDV